MGELPFILCIVGYCCRGRVLLTLTSDLGRILSKLHEVQPSGEISFISSIRIAQVSSNLDMKAGFQCPADKWLTVFIEQRRSMRRKTFLRPETVHSALRKLTGPATSHSYYTDSVHPRVSSQNLSIEFHARFDPAVWTYLSFFSSGEP